MLDSFNLTILKVECLDRRIQPKCQIYEAGSLKDEISMSSPSVHPVLIEKPDLKIEINEQDLSVSFNSKIIQKSGFHSLPLFPNTHETQLKELPKQVQVPRILINVYPKLMSPSFEITESSEGLDEISENSPVEDLSKLKSKNLELTVKVSELENCLKMTEEKFLAEMEEMTLKYKEKVRDLSEEIEKLTVIQGKNLKISAEIKKENEALKKKLEESHAEKEDVADKLEKFNKLNEDSRIREESILMILKIKDKEIMRLKKQGVSANLKVHKQQSLVCMKNTALSNSATSAKEVLEIFNYNREKFTFLQTLDKKITQITHSLGLDGILALTDELSYTIGSKKVYALAKKGLVYVRIGTSLKPIETFLINNCAQEVQKFRLLRKKSDLRTVHKKSLSELEKIENSSICRTFDDDFRKKVLTIHTSRSSVTRSRNSVSPMSQILTTRNSNIFNA